MSTQIIKQETDVFELFDPANLALRETRIKLLLIYTRVNSGINVC
jgi:hypothetical protein